MSVKRPASGPSVKVQIARAAGRDDCGAEPLPPLWPRDEGCESQPDRQPQRCRRMQRARCAERERRDRRPAAQERGDRQRAQRERQLARMEIALEAVGPRLGDRVPQRDRGKQRNRRPPVLVERGADGADADRKKDERQEVQTEKQRRQVVGRQPRDRGDGLVHERQARLRVDDGRVAGKQAWIQLAHHRRPVEGEVRCAVAVAGRVRRRQQDEGQQTEEPEPRAPSPRLRAPRSGGQAESRAPMSFLATPTVHQLSARRWTGAARPSAGGRRSADLDGESGDSSRSCGWR